tara:strand:- start:1410 stop:1745 length:336 start_codon:yes stop_codon:yes gene_type:complete
MSRLLSGFILCLLGVTSIAVIDGRFTDLSEFGVFSVVCSISVLASILLISLAAGRGREHGRWPTDSMISREEEEAMISRIEKERDEASMQDLSSKWARMEMQHLESKHSEE